MNDEQKVETTVGGLKAAFKAWAVDMEENPDNFMSYEKLDELSPEEYGVVATTYFLGLMNETETPPQPAPQ